MYAAFKAAMKWATGELSGLAADLQEFRKDLRSEASTIGSGTTITDCTFAPNTQANGHAPKGRIPTTKTK